MYKTYVQNLCTKLMYKTYVQNLCIKLMYKTYVQNLCTKLRQESTTNLNIKAASDLVDTCAWVVFFAIQSD